MTQFRWIFRSDEVFFKLNPGIYLGLSYFSSYIGTSIVVISAVTNQTGDYLKKRDQWSVYLGGPPKMYRNKDADERIMHQFWANSKHGMV